MITEVFIRFFPIFFLLFLGYILQRTGILKDAVVGGLKKIVVNAGLPAVLFLSFLTMEIKVEYLMLFGAVFVVCLLLYGAGIILHKTGLCRYSLSPFFFTGFEFGMVGVAVFSSLFGTENLGSILLLGLAHEFYIWFVYVPLLESQEHGRVDFGNIIRSFFKSPIILAILSALLLNLTGVYGLVADNFLTISVVSSAGMLSGIVTPLILLTIGSQLSFGNIDWKAAIHLIGTRLVLVSLVGFCLALFTDRFVLDLDRIMIYAFIIFFLIPPPFIIPVFLGGKHEKEARFYNNLLVLYTPVTLVVLMVIMMFLGG